MVDVVSDVIINYKSVGLDKVGSEIKQASVALDGLVISATSSEKAIGSLENRFKGLERGYKTTAANAREHAKEVTLSNNAVAAGVVSQDRANEVIAASAQKWGVATNAVQAHANASKLGRYELINLSRQFQDIGVSLSSGQSPLTVLVQQGSQIFDVFASSQGTVKGFFSQVAEGAARIITPARLATAGVVGIGAGVAYMAAEWASAQKDIEKSLIGIGARTGTTVADVNKFASDNASATGLSVDQARASAVEFTKTGDIAVGKLKGLGEAVHGYSILTGKDATNATKDLAEALSGDLVKGAEKLNQTYGFLNPAIEDNIRKLVNQGDRAKAQQLIINAMASDNKRAEATVSDLAKAWEFLGNTYSKVKNSIGDALTESPGEELTRLKGNQRRNPDALPSRVRSRMADLESQASGQGFAAFTTQQNEMANAADAVTKAIIPQIKQIQDLEAAYAKLGRAQDEAGSADNGAAQQAIQNQIAGLRQAQSEAARYNQRVAEISKSWGNVGQSTALALQAMQNMLPVSEAWTASGRMRAQEQATYLNLLDQGKTLEEASALAAKEYELSKAAAVAQGKQLVQSSQDNLDMTRAQGTEMEGVVSATIAYRNALQSGASAMQANIIYANTLAAAMERAAQAAAQQADAQAAAANAAYTADYYANKTMPTGQLGFVADPNLNVSYKGGGTGKRLDLGLDVLAVQQIISQLNDPEQVLSKALASGGVDGALAALKKLPNSGSQVSSLYDLKIAQAGDNNAAKAGIYSDEISYLQSQPQTVENMRKIVDLQNSIDQLKNSTDGLNSTNQDLLSPYYTQDPRTSHIGFRSQGMATGGYVDVPGGISSNDNMMAMIPVASGERIFVDPQSSKRGVGGGSTTINISAPITIGGNANADEVGRTVYQAMQSAGRQLQAATR